MKIKAEYLDTASRIVAGSLLIGATGDLVDYLTHDRLMVSASMVVAIMFSDGILTRMTNQEALQRNADKAKNIFRDSVGFVADKIEALQKSKEKTVMQINFLAPYIQEATKEGAYAVKGKKNWVVGNPSGKLTTMTHSEFGVFRRNLAETDTILTTLEFTDNKNLTKNLLDGVLTRYQNGKIQGMTVDKPGRVVCQNGKTTPYFFRDSVDVTDIITGKVSRLCDMLPNSSHYDELYRVLITRTEEVGVVAFAGENFLYLKEAYTDHFDIISFSDFDRYKKALDETSIPLNTMSVSPLNMGHTTIGIKRTVGGLMEGDTIENPAVAVYLAGQGYQVQYWAQGNRVELTNTGYETQERKNGK